MINNKMKILKFLTLIFLLSMNLNAKIITDILGREVKVPNKIKKIIAIGPGALRFITYIKETDKICGVENIEFKLTERFRPYYFVIKDKIKNLPVISEGGPGKMPYFSKIVLLSPDVIIGVGYTKFQADFISQKTNTPVIIVDYGNLGSINERFLKSLRILGNVFNKSQRVNSLIQYIKNLEKDLKKRTKYVQPKKVFVGAVAYKGVHGLTSTDTSIFYLELVNAINIAKYSSIQGHIELSFETLLKYNPDYIFIDESGLEIVESQYLQKPVLFKLLSAFKNHKVYKILPYNSYNTNVELTFVSAYYVGKILYPEKFSDIDLYRKSSEIFYHFFGKKINFKLDFGRIKWN